MKTASRTQNIRPAAVAGRFYPADPDELRQDVEAMLRSVEPAPDTAPVALIAPHAGYIYSGPIAATAYARWRKPHPTPLRVILVGPAHFVDVPGLAASSADAFQTPLGPVRVDIAAVGELISRKLVTISDAAHAREHSLEVQLPFLQVVLGEFSIVPLLAGDATPGQVADAIEAIWKDDHTRVVISSDLTHYLDWATAQRIDKQTAKAVEGLEPNAIGAHQACGQIPICGLLEAAKNRKLHAHLLDLRNSGDTAGPREQVVGYGAFAFTDN